MVGPSLREAEGAAVCNPPHEVYMAVSTNRGVLFFGVPTIRALLFGVHIRARDFRGTPIWIINFFQGSSRRTK